MTTRREKLVQVIEGAAERGLSIGDLAAHVRQFKLDGNSGIENYLNSAVEEFTAVPAAPCNEDAVAQIKEQLAAVTAAVEAL